jgi:phenylalanyl-tRNA synthetase beta chain
MQVYELGKAYGQQGERRLLVLAGTGALRGKGVHEPEREFNFFDIKGDVEDILEMFDLEAKSSGGPIPLYYHPTRVVRLGDLAVFGELHPDYAASYKFRDRVYLAELDVAMILESKERRAIRAVPRFPSIRRDLSLLLNKGVRYADVEQVIRRVNVPELARVEPFDRLESGPFPESKYALAISLTYQSSERTLTDDEVDSFDKVILNSLKQRLDAELRQ